MMQNGTDEVKAIKVQATNTTQELSRVKEKVSWGLIAVLLSVLLSISGAILSYFHAQLSSADMMVRAHGERLTALEVESKDMAARLSRMEAKIDQLLELRHKTQ